MAAFYKKIKVAHIEAGLRSHDMQSPFPEEMNRVLTSNLSNFHFCPTKKAVKNLLAENIIDNVYAVGNTVIDALFMALEDLSKTKSMVSDKFAEIDFSRKLILVTCHRRENFGAAFVEICAALTDIADLFSDTVEIVYPVHPNPNLKEFAYKSLQRKNIKLVDPLAYYELIWIMQKSYLVLTDSGGIQEEAPSLGKPVLVMREVTEREEGIEAGTAILVGAFRSRIVSETKKLLEDTTTYSRMSASINPYGDGKSAEKIKQIIDLKFL